jgi:hypothetical protein
MQYSENSYLMYQTKNGVVRFAPLFIHSFRLIAPRKLLEAQQFNRRYHSYEEISSVPNRLRWCRYQQGWMLGIFPRNLQLWETEQKRVSKNSWQKYFSDVIQ